MKDMLYLILGWYLSQKEVIRLAKRDGIVPPIVLLLKMNNKTRGKAFLWFFVALNKKTLLKSKWPAIRKTVRHEYRHVWQAYKYWDLYRFWCSSRQQNIYKRYYRSSLNAIEEDARRFSDDLSTGEEILQAYSVPALQDLLRRGLL